VRISPRLREVWPHIDYHRLRDVFVIRYAIGEQEELRIHHDVAQVSASVKLTDQYEGAELSSPARGCRTPTCRWVSCWPGPRWSPTRIARNGCVMA
jgi:hypothetical protein